MVPLPLAVMALLVLESGALSQAGSGEVPDRAVERFPPAADLRGYASPAGREAATAAAAPAD